VPVQCPVPAVLPSPESFWCASLLLYSPPRLPLRRRQFHLSSATPLWGASRIGPDKTRQGKTILSISPPHCIRGSLPVQTTQLLLYKPTAAAQNTAHPVTFNIDLGPPNPQNPHRECWIFNTVHVSQLQPTILPSLFQQPPSWRPFVSRHSLYLLDTLLPLTGLFSRDTIPDVHSFASSSENYPPQLATLIQTHVRQTYHIRHRHSGSTFTAPITLSPFPALWNLPRPRFELL
ncbi:hypothetical protein GQ44DRAFT_753543, partial [Phaeosphaeriaceae sp. PMI808]